MIHCCDNYQYGSYRMMKLLHNELLHNELSRNSLAVVLAHT